MILIVSKFLVPNGFSGISIYPFILLKNSDLKNDEVFLNHEKIHLRQQIQLAIVLFFVWYALEYFYLLIKKQNKRNAYRNISFEKEAYDNEDNLDYLKKKQWWNFLNYYK